MNEHILFVHGPEKGLELELEHIAPDICIPVWTPEGMCEDRYKLFWVDGTELHYKFDGRWKFPSPCEDDDCELCLADPSLREWVEVPVDD